MICESCHNNIICHIISKEPETDDECDTYEKISGYIAELKFTPENLRRHMNSHHYVNDKLIYTTRKSIKGDVGDVFFVDGWGYFALVNVSKAEPLDYEFEGFDCLREYIEELMRIYGTTNDLWMHLLVKLNDEQIEDDDE